MYCGPRSSWGLHSPWLTLYPFSPKGLTKVGPCPIFGLLLSYLNFQGKNDQRYWMIQSREDLTPYKTEEKSGWRLRKRDSFDIPANHSCTTAFSWRNTLKPLNYVATSLGLTITSITPFSLNSGGTAIPWATAALTYPRGEEYDIGTSTKHAPYQVHRMPWVYRLSGWGFHLSIWKPSCRVVLMCYSTKLRQLLKQNIISIMSP